MNDSSPPIGQNVRRMGGNGQNTEIAYVFRHALLQEAAHQLHLPGERARLHALAFAVLEDSFGGRAPDPPPLDTGSDVPCEPHPTDSVAAELAEHARQASPDGRDAGFSKARRRYLHRFADRAWIQHRPEESERGWQEYAGLTTGGSRLEALRRCATGALAANRNERGLAVLETALAEARSAGEGRAEAVILGTRAGAIWQSGMDAATVEAAFREALSSMRAAVVPSFSSMTLSNFAHFLRERSRLPEAEEVAREALTVARAERSPRLEGIALTALGQILGAAGRPDEALRTLQEALPLTRQSGNRRQEAAVLESIAIRNQSAGRHADAERDYIAALEFSRESSDGRCEAGVLTNLGGLWLNARRYAEAGRALREALSMHQELGNRRFEGLTLVRLGLVVQEEGRPEQAERLLRDAIAIHTEIRDPRGEGSARGVLAELLVACGKADQGTEQLEEALRLDRIAGNRVAEGDHLCSAAIFELKQGRADRGRAHWIRGASLLRSAGGLHELEAQRLRMLQAAERAGVPEFEDGTG